MRAQGNQLPLQAFYILWAALMLETPVADGYLKSASPSISGRRLAGACNQAGSKEINQSRAKGQICPGSKNMEVEGFSGSALFAPTVARGCARAAGTAKGDSAASGGLWLAAPPPDEGGLPSPLPPLASPPGWLLRRVVLLRPPDWPAAPSAGSPERRHRFSALPHWPSPDRRPPPSTPLPPPACPYSLTPALGHRCGQLGDRAGGQAIGRTDVSAAA